MPKTSRSTVTSPVNKVQSLNLECLDLDIITPLPKEVSLKKSFKKRSVDFKNQQDSTELKSQTKKLKKDKKMDMETGNKEVKATNSGVTFFRNKDYQIWVISRNGFRSHKEKQLSRDALGCDDQKNGIELKSRKRIIN